MSPCPRACLPRNRSSARPADAHQDEARFLHGTDFGALAAPERNSIRWMLTSPAARALYDECWEETPPDREPSLYGLNGRQLSRDHGADALAVPRSTR